VILINPPWVLAEHCRSFEDVVSVQQPLGLAYLAAVLEKSGHQVTILDAAVLNLSDEQVVSETRQLRPDLIGITTLTPRYRTAQTLAAKLKEQLDLPIVIGGSHVTALPDETMRNKCFDYAVLGEGEKTIVELANALETGQDISKVKGIACTRGTEIVKSEPRPLIEDLDSIPFPARHLLPPLGKYRPSPASCKRLPQATMMTSRGCPYRCAFCDRAVFGNYVRTRTACNVVDEMELLVKKHGAREIRFWDDIFNINQQRVLDISEQILLRKLDVPWTCLARANHMTAQVLEQMAKAGCWQVDYGIESGNQAILNGIVKGQTLDQVEKVVKMTRKAGIGVRGFFMLALPGETESTMRDTIRFAKSLDLTSAVFHVTTPFPGTALFEIAKASGELRADVSYDSYMLGFSDDVPYVPKGLTAARVKQIEHAAYSEFYLRPRFVMKRILEIRTLTDILRYVHAFLTVNRLS
jgi:anaerobic magnesium-protoporphyrin IX monomethyl ester cyclase